MLDEKVWWRTDYALAVLSSWQGSCARAVIAEVCARMLLHMCVFLSVCVCTYVHGVVRECVCVCLNACLSVCMHAYVFMHSVCVLVYMHKSAWVWVRCVLHGFLCNMLEYKCACMQCYLYLEYVHPCIECWFVVKVCGCMHGCLLALCVFKCICMQCLKLCNAICTHTSVTWFTFLPVTAWQMISLF